MRLYSRDYIYLVLEAHYRRGFKKIKIGLAYTSCTALAGTNGIHFIESTIFVYYVGVGVDNSDYVSLAESNRKSYKMLP